MKYFDAHCHIQFDAYAPDRDELIEQMRVAEVGGIVVGVNEKSSREAIDIAQHHEHLFAGVGLHPNAVIEESFERSEYQKLAEDGKVVAIGECGLDYFRPSEPAAVKQKQREVFEEHLEIAATLGKPMMIHARPSKGTQDAYQDLVQLLKEGKERHGDRLTGDIHFFVGGLDEARALIDLDFTLSYTAVLTFTHDYDEVVRFAPLSHLLTETDSPYVAPPPNRGSRNDPRSIPAIVRAMAGIRGEDEEVVREAVLENARRVFRLPN